MRGGKVRQEDVKVGEEGNYVDYNDSQHEKGKKSDNECVQMTVNDDFAQQSYIRNADEQQSANGNIILTDKYINSIMYKTRHCLLDFLLTQNEITKTANDESNEETIIRTHNNIEQLKHLLNTLSIQQKIKNTQILETLYTQMRTAFLDDKVDSINNTIFNYTMTFNYKNTFGELLEHLEIINKQVLFAVEYINILLQLEEVSQVYTHRTLQITKYFIKKYEKDNMQIILLLASLFTEFDGTKYLPYMNALVKCMDVCITYHICTLKNIFNFYDFYSYNRKHILPQTVLQQLLPEQIQDSQSLTPAKLNISVLQQKRQLYNTDNLFSIIQSVLQIPNFQNYISQNFWPSQADDITDFKIQSFLSLGRGIHECDEIELRSKTSKENDWQQNLFKAVEISALFVDKIQYQISFLEVKEVNDRTSPNSTNYFTSRITDKINYDYNDSRLYDIVAYDQKDQGIDFPLNIRHAVFHGYGGKEKIPRLHRPQLLLSITMHTCKCTNLSSCYNLKKLVAKNVSEVNENDIDSLSNLDTVLIQDIKLKDDPYASIQRIVVKLMKQCKQLTYIEINQCLLDEVLTINFPLRQLKCISMSYNTVLHQIVIDTSLAEMNAIEIMYLVAHTDSSQTNNVIQLEVLGEPSFPQLAFLRCKNMKEIKSKIQHQIY